MASIAITHGNIVFPSNGVASGATFSPRQNALFMPLQPLQSTQPPRPLNLSACVRDEFTLVGAFGLPPLTGCVNPPTLCPVSVREDDATGKVCDPKSVIGKMDDD